MLGNLDDAFTGKTQPLPAGDKQQNLLCLGDELPEHIGGGYDVLEVVDDQQHLAGTEVVDHRVL